MSAYITELPFEKWQGCLNDFLIVSVDSQTLLPTMRSLVVNARGICAKDGSGIGADGIILVCAGEKHMVWIINKDGSFAKNCGNGLRCAAMSFFKNNSQSSLEITLGGKSVSCKLFSPSPERILVATDMGNVRLNEQLDWYDEIKELVQQVTKELSLPDLAENFSACEVGNKHVIFFSSRPRFLEKLGPLLQRFDENKGINVHLAWGKKSAKGMVYNARTYERGVGETAACGTGACAIAAAVFAEKESETEEVIEEKWLKIKMLGGMLLVKKARITERMVLAGPAQYVFRGFIDL